jgi:hypothetical protein
MENTVMVSNLTTSKAHHSASATIIKYYSIPVTLLPTNLAHKELERLTKLLLSNSEASKKYFSN